MPLACQSCGTVHACKALCGGTVAASDYENMNMLVAAKMAHVPKTFPFDVVFFCDIVLWSFSWSD
jgi:hypothetical protein